MTRTFIAAALLASVATPASAATTLNFIGQQVIASGTQVLGTTLGGLSGLDYDAATNSYIAISDDRSQSNPARFYRLNLDITPAAFNGVNFNGVTTLLRPDGSAYPALSIDPEAIRLNAAGRIVYTSEGDVNLGVNAFIREANIDGSYVQDFAVPGYFQQTGAAGLTGIRNNLAFESLTIGSGGTLFTATENALKQDGPAATAASGTASRILTIDPATGLAGAEYVYLTDPVAVAPATGQFATNGLVEMLHIDGNRFLAVERSFTAGIAGTGNTIKLFEVDLTGATNVSGQASINGITYTPVSKTLLLNLDTLGIPLDNIEAISFGQTLSNGARSLILASDNNFSATQFTQLLAFEVNTTTATVPEPSVWSMLICGFAFAGLALRRKPVLKASLR